MIDSFINLTAYPSYLNLTINPNLTNPLTWSLYITGRFAYYKADTYHKDTLSFTVSIQRCIQTNDTWYYLATSSPTFKVFTFGNSSTEASDCQGITYAFNELNWDPASVDSAAIEITMNEANRSINVKAQD